MGLDITIKQRKELICPHCGERIGTRDISEETSGGRVWYHFLEMVGYYAEPDKRTPTNDWYGKDMVLSRAQADSLFRFCKNEEPYNWHYISVLVAVAEAEGDMVVINADW